LCVSALGAKSSSSNFYLRLKGEMEEAIGSLNIPSKMFFRPSFLLGDRQEFRLGEVLGIVFIKPFAFLLPSKMKPISAHMVAKAMLAATKKELEGTRVFHYKEMQALVQKG
jgi:uncharacterized protein YbjT (DUF2867 family)